MIANVHSATVKKIWDDIVVFAKFTFACLAIPATGIILAKNLGFNLSLFPDIKGVNPSRK